MGCAALIAKKQPDSESDEKNQQETDNGDENKTQTPTPEKDPNHNGNNDNESNDNNNNNNSSEKVTPQNSPRTSKSRDSKEKMDILPSPNIPISTFTHRASSVEIELSKTPRQQLLSPTVSLPKIEYFNKAIENERSPPSYSSRSLPKTMSLSTRATLEQVKRTFSRSSSGSSIHSSEEHAVPASFDIFEDTPSYAEIRQALGTKLSSRSKPQDLISRNILKGALNGNILSAQLSFSFNQASENLGKKLATRPHREWLLQHHILEDQSSSLKSPSFGVMPSTVRGKIRRRLSDLLKEDVFSQPNTTSNSSSPIVISVSPAKMGNSNHLNDLFGVNLGPHNTATLSPQDAPIPFTFTHSNYTDSNSSTDIIISPPPSSRDIQKPNSPDMMIRTNPTLAASWSLSNNTDEYSNNSDIIDDKNSTNPHNLSDDFTIENPTHNNLSISTDP